MPKVIEEKPVTISEVKKILEGIKDDKLDQSQRRTLDFSKKFAKIDYEEGLELISKLVEGFGVTQEEAVQIVNCMPSSLEELRVFFTASKRKIVTTPQLEEILKLIDEYRKK